MNGITIRQEVEKDYRAVETITREAFWNVYVPGCDEHYLVHNLRKHADFIPELDLIAECNGQIVGNIMYAKAWLEDENGNKKEIVTFGPLTVQPAYQRQGIGKALMEESFRIAEKMGYDAIVIFGNPGNYITSGFKSCKKYHVMLENGGFPTAMLVKELRGNAFDGRKWYYHESAAYQLDSAGFAEFDKSFEHKEKKYLPSQEEFFIYSHSSVTW